jgi:hypothetical protein
MTSTFPSRGKTASVRGQVRGGVHTEPCTPPRTWSAPRRLLLRRRGHQRPRYRAGASVHQPLAFCADPRRETPPETTVNTSRRPGVVPGPPLAEDLHRTACPGRRDHLRPQRQLHHLSVPASMFPGRPRRRETAAETAQRRHHTVGRPWGLEMAAQRVMHPVSQIQGKLVQGSRLATPRARAGAPPATAGDDGVVAEERVPGPRYCPPGRSLGRSLAEPSAA